jgi:hypothetical protein
MAVGGGTLSRKLEVIITGQTRGLSSALGSAGKSADTFAAKLRRGVGRAAPYAAVGLGLVALQAKQGVAGVMEDEKALANLENTLKATGNAANITSKDFFAYANSLQAQTGTSAAAITQGAALLGTFKNVRDEAGKGNDVFRRATDAALDLSAKGFGSLEGSNKMLGKALNDPIKGISALSRAGVTFTDQQKAQIKAMTESGNLLGAQKIILGEVETQVGGAAKAFGETTAGQVERGKRAFEELQKALALALLPAIEGIAGGLSRLSGFLQNNQGVVKIAVLAFTGLAVAVLALKAAFAIGGAIALLANPIGLVVVAAAALAAGLIFLYRNSETARRVMDAAFKAIRAVVTPVINHVKAVIQTFVALLRGDFRGAVNGVKAIVSNAFGAIAGLIRRIIPIAIAAAKAVGTAIVNGIKAGAGLIGTFAVWLLGKIKAGITSLPGLVKSAFLTIGGAVVNGIKDGISNAWSGLVSWLKNKVSNIPLVGRFFANQMGQMSNDMSRAMSTGAQTAAQMLAAIPQAVSDSIREARSNLASLTGSLAGMAAERIRASTRAAFGADPTAARGAYEQERAARERLMIDRQRMELQEAVKAARTRADRTRAQQALADFEAEQNLARLEQAARDEESVIAQRDAEAQAAGERAQQDINNLVARFNQGAISADQFRTELTSLIGGPAGDELGEAFKLNFTTALDDVITQLREFAEFAGEALGLAPGTVVSPAGVRAQLTADADEKAVEEAVATSRRNHAAWTKRRAAFLRNLKAGKTKLKTIAAWEKANPAPVKLAAGGILRRPVLAGEAGPEAVIPLTGSLGRNALARAMEDASAQAGGGGMVINLTVHGVMAGDVREFAQRLKPELARVLTAGY